MVVGAPAVEVPFVGRADELLLLQRLLDDAVAGHPRVVLLTGEAGVGKSRLLRELLASAASGGVRVLEGVCHEDSAIPYLPIATALRSIDHEGARRLVPTAEATTSALARGEPEDHRMRLFLDATSALLASASLETTLLVVEDVQWADDATADLIRHLALSGTHEAALSSLPLCVVLTARGRWVPDAPRPLARLAREGAAVELHLEHFDAAEVHALIRAIVGARPDSDVTSAVWEASSGNPLLVRGVVDRNLRAGTLVVAAGVVALSGGRALQAPTDLDEEIGLQIDRADEPTRALLTLAAVVGGGVLEPTLRAAAEPGLDVDATIRRAVELRLIEVDRGQVGFTHPQIRHVLYEGLDPTTRAKLHLRVAEALETSDIESGRGLAVAHHLLSSGLAPGERLARWTLQAGDEAWSTGAWSEALGSYAIALEVGARSVLTADEVAAVLLRTGVAAYYANDDSCAGWLDQGSTAAAELGDVVGETEALLLQARFHLIGTAAAVGTPPPTEALQSLLPRLADQPALRARVHATISDLQLVALDQQAAAHHAALAEAELDHVGDDDTATVSQVHVVLGLREMTALALPDARRHFEIARAKGDDHRRMAAATRVGLCQLVEGELDAAATTLGEARRGERALGSHAGQQLPAAGLAAIAVLQGRLPEAERLCAEVEALYDIQEYAFTPGLVYPTLAAERSARGDLEGAGEALRRWRECGGRGTWRYEAYLQLLSGDLDGLADGLRDRRWRAPGAPTFFTVGSPGTELEFAL